MRMCTAERGGEGEGERGIWRHAYVGEVAVTFTNCVGEMREGL